MILSSMGLRKKPDKFLSRSKEVFPESDRLLLGQPDLAKAYIDTVGESFRSGIGGANQEAAATRFDEAFSNRYNKRENEAIGKHY